MLRAQWIQKLNCLIGIVAKNLDWNKKEHPNYENQINLFFYFWCVKFYLIQ